MRRIVARDAPVEHHGDFYDMPLAGGMGLGKALKSTVHPLRTAIPIHIAAEGPKNVALAAEIGDGWLPLFFAPKEDAFYRDCLRRGFEASGDPGKAERFEVTSSATIVVGDDVEACADRVRPNLALYAGGMGARGANFHFEVFARMGYEDVATKVQELYLDGRKAEAAAAIPLSMVEDVALVGPIEKIRDELPRWRDTCITTFLVGGPASALAGTPRRSSADPGRTGESARHTAFAEDGGSSWKSSRARSPSSPALVRAWDWGWPGRSPGPACASSPPRSTRSRSTARSPN